MSRQLLIVVSVFALAVGSTACATKKFVRTEVGAVNDKTTTLAGRTEENEQRIKGVDERVSQVDQKASVAGQAADQAKQAADQAKQAAASADTRVTDLADVGRSLVYGVVLNESQGGFRFANASLPDEAQGAARQADGRRLGRIRRPSSSRSKATRIRAAGPRSTSRSDSTAPKP